MIVLPENIIRNLYIDPEDLVTVSGEESKSSKNAWFTVAKFDRETYEKNAVVHEYLHYLGFDNFTSGVHNSVGAADSLIRFDDDLVYSCAELSFPTWTLDLKHGRYLAGGAYKDFNLGKACLMCAMAKISKKKMRIDGSRGEKAISLCAPYRELRY